MNRVKVPGIVFTLLFILITSSAYAYEVSEATMGNGLKVLVQEDHSAELVAVDVWVKAGNINETPENNGVSHFIEHLVFKGTKKRPQGKADLEIESLGASLDASTSRDWAHFHTTVASRYYKTALDVLADVLANASFNTEDIERERKVILDEIARRDENPLELVDGLLHKTAYKEHPYRLTVEGTKESVQKITRENILKYYNTYYVPNNMTVVIVGDVDKMEAVDAVGSVFSALTRKDLPAVRIPQEPEQTEVRRDYLAKPLKQTHMMIGFHGPSVASIEDTCAMDVLLSYLGVGYRSWLSSELRDNQKLIIQGTGDFLTHKDPSILSIYAALEPGNEKKVEQAVLGKIKDLRANPVSDFDLSRAKRSLEGNYAFDNETYQGQANALGFYDAISGYKFAVNYIANIRKVTPADVQRVVQKYLDPDKAIVVTVGPEGAAQ